MKKLLSVMLAAALALSVTACGNTASSESTAASEPAAESASSEAAETSEAAGEDTAGGRVRRADHRRGRQAHHVHQRRLPAV